MSAPSDALLRSYTKVISRPECNPSFESLHCLAELDQDVGAALPYLNAELGGNDIVADPPSLTLKVHGKLITIHARQIAINALADEEQADRILAWLQNEINRVWSERNDIKPLFSTPSKPQVFELFKLLPHTNCGECAQPTCMVFAVRLSEGVLTPEDCPQLPPQTQEQFAQYLLEHPPQE